jgi:fructokinase
MNQIICFGEALWDMLPTGAKPGGALLNVAVHLKKQGQNPVLISKIGNDENGKKLLDFLNRSGVDTRFIQTDNELATSQVMVHLDENNSASYEICEPVAWDAIRTTDELKTLAKNAELIIFGTLASRNETSRNTLFQLIENTNANLLLDVNLRPPFNSQAIVEEMLYRANMIKLNNDELLEIAGWNNVSGDDKSLIKFMAEFYNCPTICVTRGENGAILFTENSFYEHSGFKVIATDTVGAGDSFLASLISNLLNHKTPKKSLEYACATGAFVASKKGAVPEYSEQDIGKIINSGNS